MNEELKKRISAINSGIIPEGYKKTKVGIVPEEWAVVRFQNITERTGKERNNSENNYPIYSINNKKGFSSQEDQFENSGYANTSKDLYRIVYQGEFAYNPARINVGSIGLLKNQEAVIISSLYVCFKMRNNCDLSFFEQYFKSHRFSFDVNNYTEGSVREYLFYDNFSKIHTILPPLPEQHKIAEILSTQDKLIELQEKKTEQLKELKKAYLQKMFPKKGSKYPEIRFKGFTDAWEQRKLGECVTFLDTMRKPLKESEREKGIYPYYGASGIVDYVSDYIFDEELVLLSEDGANITDRNYPVCFLASGKYWVNNHAHVLKVNTENENNFICNSLERMDFTQYNSGMAMPKLNKDVCLNIPLFCPVFEEQKQIGDFFRNLDNLITLHQRKLEQEKQKKKALMQLLLTGKVRIENVNRIY